MAHHPSTPTFVSRVPDAWRADYDTPILSCLSSTPEQLRRYSADDSLDAREGETAINNTTAMMTRLTVRSSKVLGGHLHGGSISIGGLPVDDSDDDDEEKDDDSGNELDERGKSYVTRSEREDLSGLVDFLNNTKPPADNYMSIPFENFREVKGRGRWSMLRRVGRRRSRSLPKAPPGPLILPDSAVSGITIGGHRHIAISIPLEAMPFAVEANSHCYDSSTRPYRDPDPDLLLPIPISDRPLRVPGVRALSSMSISRPYRPARSLSTTQLGQRGNPPAYKSFERRNSQQDQDHQDGCMCSVGPNAAVCHMKMEHLQETGYPARRSSVTASRGYTLATAANNMVPYHRNGRTNSTGTYTFPSYTWLPVSRGAASPAKRGSRQPSPISEAPSRAESVEKNERGSDRETSVASTARASSDTYLGSDPEPPLPVQDNVTRLSPRVSIACRREKVRDKKRRDMETLRKAKERGQNSLGGKPDVSTTSGNAVSQDSGPQLVLCPIQVVVDMEPAPLSAKRPESFNEKLQRLAVAHSQRNSLSSVESSSSFASQRAPLSTLGGSPLPRQRLHQKTRSDHRGLGEREDKLLRDGGHHWSHPSHQRNKESRTDRQILRLYDTYRENRIQDAERRIRKLENNRDIWLQALIPLLDDMNQTIKAANSKNNMRDKEDVDLDGDVAFVDKTQVLSSDRGARATTITRSISEGRLGSGGRKRSSKDRSLSRERLVALLAQKLEEVEDYDDDDDDDDDAESWYERTKLRSDSNGMVSMELLMEELAGEATRRQRRLAAEMRGDTD